MQAVQVSTVVLPMDFPLPLNGIVSSNLVLLARAESKTANIETIVLMQTVTATTPVLPMESPLPLNLVGLIALVAAELLNVHITGMTIQLHIIAESVVIKTQIISRETVQKNLKKRHHHIIAESVVIETQIISRQTVLHVWRLPTSKKGV